MVKMSVKSRASWVAGRGWEFAKRNARRVLGVSVIVTIAIFLFQWGTEQHRSNVFEDKLSWLAAREILENYAWLQSKRRVLLALEEWLRATIEEPVSLERNPEAYGRLFSAAVRQPLESESMGIALTNVNVFSRADFLQIGELYEAIRRNRAEEQRRLATAQEILQNPSVAIDDADSLLAVCQALLEDNVSLAETIEKIYDALRWDRRFGAVPEADGG